jgi:hypothetical protein
MGSSPKLKAHGYRTWLLPLLWIKTTCRSIYGCLTAQNNEGTIVCLEARSQLYYVFPLSLPPSLPQNLNSRLKILKLQLYVSYSSRKVLDFGA